MPHSEHPSNPLQPPLDPDHRRGYREGAVELSGLYSQPIYNPRGEIDSLLLSVNDAPVQILFNPDRHKALVSSLKPGQQLSVIAVRAPPSLNGEPVHPVYNLNTVTLIDGQPLPEHPQEFQGQIARLNYARHGEPNGVVLDTGDFIHLRTEGFAGVKLGIGDTVRVTGVARLMTGGGYAVEAGTVNGNKVAVKKRKPPKTSKPAKPAKPAKPTEAVLPLP